MECNDGMKTDHENVVVCSLLFAYVFVWKDCTAHRATEWAVVL